jgi:7-cyano-7-deazaguanine tRNA-ribosyltransferase
MLDVFGRPDMTREEIEAAVDTTANRANASLSSAGEKLLLNGPIQGGTHQDLRAESSSRMAASEVGGRGFSVHPIGGIVPLMETQRYSDLFSVILSSMSALPSDRPVHIFGCGHPMLFPLCIALGADLFDSAAYALFAKDGRILSEEGTHRIDSAVEWPVSSRYLEDYTPREVREMDKKSRTALLARHNLEVTQRELSRCREAIRNGSIWNLAERRSHASPHLRKAFKQVLEAIQDGPEIPSGRRMASIISSTDPVRPSSEPFSEDVSKRPHIIHAGTLLENRWKLPGSWWDGSTGPPSSVVILHGSNPPWRTAYGSVVAEILQDEPKTAIFVKTPLGLIPYSLEDLSPWCRIEGNDDSIPGDPNLKESYIRLDRLSLDKIPLEYRIASDSDIMMKNEIRAWLDRCSTVDRLAVLCGVKPSDGCRITDGMNVRHSKTGRPVNVLSKDRHLFSPRLNDGGISLALEGAKAIHSLMDIQPPLGFSNHQENHLQTHPGIARVTIHSDAIPFVGAGRNVMHGFVIGADEWITVGQPCLVVDENGTLVAHGNSNSTMHEMSVLRKGVAVRIREGALP